VLLKDLSASELTERTCIIDGQECVFQKAKKRFLRKDLPKVARQMPDLPGWVCFSPAIAGEAIGH